MAHLRVALAGVAAIFVASLVPLWPLIGLIDAKTVGFGAITATLVGSIVSPWCWLIAVVSFGAQLIYTMLQNYQLKIAHTCTNTIERSRAGDTTRRNPLKSRGSDRPTG